VLEDIYIYLFINARKITNGNLLSLMFNKRYFYGILNARMPAVL